MFKKNLLLCFFFIVFSQEAHADSFVESFADFPAALQQTSQYPRLPQRSAVGYGFSSQQLGARLACGPSPVANAMSCVDVAHRSSAGLWPLPGNVTSTPLFVKTPKGEGSWVVGTSEGFIVSIKAQADGFPRASLDAFAMWGPRAREAMAALKPQAGTTTSLPFDSGSMWNWVNAASAEFVGEPKVSGSRLFVLSANQYLNAIDLNSGKLLWASRLAADAPLRLESVALSATEKEVLVGNNDGDLLALSVEDGKQLWRVHIPSRVDDRFPAIFAQPIVDGKSVLVSNTNNVTSRVSLGSQVVEWSFPLGTIGKALVFKDLVYLPGVDGSVVALNKGNGAFVWSTIVTKESPIASLAITHDGLHIFAASQNGTISLLEAEKGKLEGRIERLGEVLGEFQQGRDADEVCLSFKVPGFRCFNVTEPKIALESKSLKVGE